MPLARVTGVVLISSPIVSAERERERKRRSESVPYPGAIWYQGQTSWKRLPHFVEAYGTEYTHVFTEEYGTAQSNLCISSGRLTGSGNILLQGRL